MGGRGLGYHASKTCKPVQSTKGSEHKKGGAQGDLVSPSATPPPATLQEGSLPAVELLLSLVRDPREQLGHSHEPL